MKVVCGDNSEWQKENEEAKKFCCQAHFEGNLECNCDQDEFQRCQFKGCNFAVLPKQLEKGIVKCSYHHDRKNHL